MGIARSPAPKTQAGKFRERQQASNLLKEIGSGLGEN